MDSSLQDWTAAVEASTREFVTTTLFQEAKLSDRLPKLPPEIYGAIISLANNSLEATLGVFSEPAGCQRLARSFLGLEDTAPVPEGEIADVLGEIANILAGSVKARIAGRVAGLKIGMPCFIQGGIHFPEPYEFSGMRACWGEIAVSWFLIVRDRRNRDESC